jgi:RNA polymerase sigma-70 factor (ECF subfamily)
MRRDLVTRAQQGDEDAFAELATGIADRLFSIAYRVLRDVEAANDATQETLVILWRELPALRDPDRFDSWSYRIIVNAAYAESRKLRPPVPVALARPTDAEDDPISAIVDRDQLERGFRRLPVEQRAALVLQHYLDLSLPQIAEVLGVPVGTVRSRLHYARDAMRAALEADLRPAAVRRGGTA